MVMVIFAILSAAVALGALLLVGHRPRFGGVRRSTVAVAHGVIGAAGLTGLVLATLANPAAASIAVLANLMIATGLAIGLTVAVCAWRKRRPNTLLVPLHVVFAGIGYLILIGVALS